MRFPLFTGIFLALTLILPACGGGSGGGGGGPLGGLEGESTADSLTADDLEAMCSGVGGKAATAIPNASTYDMDELMKPLCVLFSVMGFGEGSTTASTVAECDAFVTMCMQEMASEGDGGFGDFPSPTEAAAEVKADCLESDWSSCTANVDEITACVDSAVASAKLAFSNQVSAVEDLKDLTCAAAISSTPEELEGLQRTAMGEGAPVNDTVVTCEELLAKCDNDTIQSMASLGSDSGNDDTEGGGPSGWDGIPETSEQGCCDGQPAPFCEELACVECVCGEDSFCCEDSWDGLCAQKAQNSCADSCTCE